jgi:ectoine hydroxylase-related dioxygenase (phytanoyl-CoA dioxygenase family)
MKTSTAASIHPSPLRTALEHYGFVLVPNVLTSSELLSLREACRNITDLARLGKWPYIRTLPKQFPPWSSDTSAGIWGVQHLLHPSQRNAELFASSYFSPIILSTVTQILGCGISELVMELYNLLVRPDMDFALRWHRDDIGPEVEPEDEERILKQPIVHAQWNLALYDDASLIVVPGSHARARTEAERAADPFEIDLQGQQVVEMKAGDVVFYNNNILHRGVYKKGVERMTLHGSMGMVGGDQARARNVLQHGVGSWVGQCDFSGLEHEVEGRRCGDIAEAMRRALMNMGGSEDIGFSQSDD